MPERESEREPILAFDVGNTSVKCALGSGDRWRVLFRTPTTPAGSLAQRMMQAASEAKHDLESASRCVASSVHPAADEAVSSFWRTLRRGDEARFFGRDLPVPIDVLTARPEQVGADRQLLALGARETTGAPCIVVSAGTAVTIDLVDAEGRFAGGAIAPGLGLGASALHQKAAQLPLVAPAAPRRLPAVDTEDAIRAGLYWSCVGGVLTLAACYRAVAGCRDAPVVCTGSDAELILPALEGARYVPMLIFCGMGAALGLTRAR